MENYFSKLTGVILKLFNRHRKITHIEKPIKRYSQQYIPEFKRYLQRTIPKSIKRPIQKPFRRRSGLGDYSIETQKELRLSSENVADRLNIYAPKQKLSLVDFDKRLKDKRSCFPNIIVLPLELDDDIKPMKKRYSQGISLIEALIEAQRESGLTNEEISKKLGIHPNYYLKIRKETINPEKKLKDRITDFYLQREIPSSYKYLEEAIYNGIFCSFSYLKDGVVSVEDSVERNLHSEDQSYLIKRALNKLSLREKNIVKGYFGLDEDMQEIEEKTLQEIADEYGLTRERIRQIKEKAIRKLNHPSRSKELSDYL